MEFKELAVKPQTVQIISSAQWSAHKKETGVGRLNLPASQAQTYLAAKFLFILINER